MPANTAVPGEPRSRSDRNSSDGFGDLAQAGAGHLEHADLVGRAEAVLDRAQDAELVRAFALEREHGIDHVLDHARAGDLAVLGDVADQDHGGAASAWRSGSAPAPTPRTCVTVPGADSTMSVHMVWIESMMTRRGVAPSDKRCDDVFNRSLSRELDRSAGETEPFGAQPHLRDRLFARNIDRALPGLRQRRRDLDQQRRLADAGIAAEQQHRAAHEAAAGDAVEFGDAGGEAGRVLRLAGQRLEREAPALARRAAGTRPARSAPSSAIVFHSPQASHLPCQRP